MNVKRIVFLILISCPVFSSAQEKTDTLLYKIYHKTDRSRVFSAIDAIKKLKKDKIKASLTTLTSNLKNDIFRNADLLVSSPWPLLTFNEFYEYKSNGNRLNYENKYFYRRNKLNTLVIAELVADDGRYLNEIVNGLGLICEESTWALPAHMTLQKAGTGLPDVNEPIIDLFVAQTAMTLSYVKYLLGEKLDAYAPMMLQRVDYELRRRVVDPYLSRDDFWWMGFKTDRKMNNWNIFINSNLLSCALFSQEDPKIRQLMIEKSLKSVDNFLSSYPADGGCDEGPSYWNLAGGALIEYIDLLSVFSSQQMDFSRTELIHQIGSYIYKVHIDQNYYVNFADAAVANAQDAVKVYKFGRLFKDQKLLQFAAYLRKINNGEEKSDLGNINNFINSLETNQEFTDIEALAPQLGYAWLQDIQVLTARQASGTGNGLFFAAKGGSNGESHNHNDVGNFIVYKDGIPLIIDAGVGVYTRQTFSADRYKLWYMQSDWHNCPTINGQAQLAGEKYKAKFVTSKHQDNSTIFQMDIAAAYPQDADVNFWNRTFLFDHNKGTLSLKEAYSLKKFKQRSVLNFLINGTVTSLKEGTLLIKNAQGKTISMIYDPGEFDYQIEVRKIDDARLAASWTNDISRLILRIKGNRLKATHVITFKT